MLRGRQTPMRGHPYDADMKPKPPRTAIAEALGRRIGVGARPVVGVLRRLPVAAPFRAPLGRLSDLARSVAACAVVVTLGARGALVVPADGGTPVLQAPPPVTPVDTTGAGDCFCGALAQALAGGAGLTEAVRHAVAAAALSTTGPGARGALPDDTAVRALLPQVPDATEVG